MAADVIELTDSEFDTQVLKSPTPVLVDFWASWCGPCRTLSPIVADVAKGHAGKLKVGKLNVDDHPNAPGRYQVQALPTLVLFKNGEAVEQIVGLVAKTAIETMLSRHM